MDKDVAQALYRFPIYFRMEEDIVSREFISTLSDTLQIVYHSMTQQFVLHERVARIHAFHKFFYVGYRVPHQFQSGDIVHLISHISGIYLYRPMPRQRVLENHL